MNKFGYTHHNNTVVTYEIAEAMTEKGGLFSRLDVIAPLALGEYTVWPNGVNNLAPNECEELISGNRLLPSLIEKQVSILYGRGPQLYTEEITDEGDIIRHYLSNQRIQNWLDSWRENGLPDSYQTYLNKCIRSYYNTEGIFSKWHFTKGQLLGINLPLLKTLPVAGLEHVNEIKARLGSKKNLIGRTDVDESELELVILNNWASGNIRSEAKIYPKFDYTRPTSNHSAISYSKNPNHGTEVYATNVFFKGVKDWIRGCNANPRYINSYLENALSARHHVIIPAAWVEEKVSQLQELCNYNASQKAKGLAMKNVTVGDKTLEVGDIYTPDILQKLINLELQKMTEWLSGEGKNQGKLYATLAFHSDTGTTEQWKIEPIDQKYKEYIEALISYDKRADMVLLSSKGIDSSISNVSADGTISKSGSDAYYNYLIYLMQQTLPESIICADINYAIKLNFPEEYAKGIRLGFYRPNIQRQEDTTPSQRLGNQKEL